jgi:hypothetical protein
VIGVRNFIKSRLCRTIVLAALPLGLGSAPGFGQFNPEAHVGSRIPNRPQQLSQDRTQQILSAYATCIVGRQRSLASEYVLDRSSLRFDRKYDALADGACLEEAIGSSFDDVGLKMGEDAMRFAVAEALLQNEIATIDPDRLPKTARLRMPVLIAADYEPQVGRQYSADQMKALDEKRAKDQSTLIMYRFGECAVRSDPRGAQALLKAAPNSDAEGAAVQQLVPVLGNCLEKGAQVTLNRAKFRGAVALSYYALAHAPLATASSQ